MRRRVAALTVAAVFVLAGCGSDTGSGDAGAGSSADRTVDVEMRDIAYSPTSLDVRTGETVRFNFKNSGQVVHDAFIGDAAAQDAHEKEMREGHAGHDHGASGVSVSPGKTASLTYRFDKAGQTIIGCHEPGHYIGGMKITVNVA